MIIFYKRHREWKRCSYLFIQPIRSGFCYRHSYCSI